MKKKRKGILAVGLVAAVVVAVPPGLYVWSLRHAPGRFIDREHCRRIKKGMKQGEVEAILGVPPGVYAKKGIPRPGLYRSGKEAPVARVESWVGDEGVVEVTFDEQDAAVSRTFEKARELRRSSYLQQVLDWLRPPTLLALVRK